MNQRMEGGGVWRPGLAMLYAELDRLDDARREFDRMAPDDFGAFARDSLWPATGSYLAEVCIALGDAERAAPLYRDLSRFANLNLMVAMTVCLGPADRVLGGLASLLGREADAGKHFRAAEAMAEKSGSPIWLARVLYDWARFARRSGSLAESSELAARALDLAERHGMSRLAEQCRALPHTSTLVRPELPDGLSAREVEVLRLIAAGSSNRDIGERLHISTNTAANHVRSILQKTGSANRAEAATYAARHELL
jgi:ATP/maltotriose-dependent transcriptional regulator MalT